MQTPYRPYKYFLFGGGTLGFIGLYTLSFLYTRHSSYIISYYGIIMIIYFFYQNVASYLNTQKYKIPLVSGVENQEEKSTDEWSTIAIESDGSDVNNAIDILVVGRRERPEYWEQCVESIISLSPINNIERIMIVIDGDEEIDYIMTDIANSFLSESPCPIIIHNISHSGKRGAIHHGLQYLKTHAHESPFVLLTDSDTILEPETPLHMRFCLEENENNGCCTGALNIFNQKDGILPKIIHARYAYAFHIERAAASYVGCMTCCSGPLGMYRYHVLNDNILYRFSHQSIAKVKCEPGDDRHLTNLVMGQGYYSRQTSWALASTEAPSSFHRFFLQQLRWSRSFYREVWWQIRCIPHHSFYLIFLTIYELTFPWLVGFWCFYSLYSKTSRVLFLKTFLISFCILLIRTAILLNRLRSWEMLYNIAYYPLYFAFLLPTKLYALFTFLKSNWVTSARASQSKRCKHWSPDALFLYPLYFIWNVSLIYGIVRQYSSFSI